MRINVNSEIGKLKKVLVHRPGKEVERVYPEIFNTILFDDIMYLENAQKQHDLFVENMEKHNIEVFYIEKIVAEVFDKDPSLKEKFIDEFIRDAKIVSKAVKDAVKDFFLKIEDNLDFVRTAIAGIKKSEISPKFTDSLVDQSIVGDDKYPFYIDPIPNILFQRDPIASVFNSMNLHNMWSKTRKREKIFYEYVFKFHPRFQDMDIIMNPTDEGWIEGGDILVINKKTLFVGIGERTTPQALETFCQRLFEKYELLEQVIGIKIPKSHATMHLDTVLTQVDYKKFIVSPEIDKESTEIFVVKKNKASKGLIFKKKHSPIKNVIQEFVDKDVELIYVGGKDLVRTKREQWNDATNSLCIEPGTAIVYDRNFVTNKILKKHGVKLIEIQSSELIRGRGGPRCMSMPLERGEI